MTNLTIELSKELEKELNHLEETTKKPKNFHIKEALIRYLEDMEDLKIALKRSKEKGKIYTSEEAIERLKELREKQN